MPDDDRTGFEHGSPDRLGGVQQTVRELRDDRIAGERLEPLGAGLVGERLGEPAVNRFGFVAVEEDERRRFDLHVAPVALDVTVDADRVADLDVRVCADARLDERGDVDDARLVSELEDGRAAGLSNADDLPVDSDRVADRLGEGFDLDAFGLVVGLPVSPDSSASSPAAVSSPSAADAPFSVSVVSVASVSASALSASVSASALSASPSSASRTASAASVSSSPAASASDSLPSSLSESASSAASESAFSASASSASDSSVFDSSSGGCSESASWTRTPRNSRSACLIDHARSMFPLSRTPFTWTYTSSPGSRVETVEPPVELRAV